MAPKKNSSTLDDPAWNEAAQALLHARDRLRDLADELGLEDADDALIVLSAAVQFLGPCALGDEDLAHVLSRAARIIRGGGASSAGGVMLGDYARTVWGAIATRSDAGVMLQRLAQGFGASFLYEDRAHVTTLLAAAEPTPKSVRAVALDLLMRARARPAKRGVPRWFLLPIERGETRVKVQKRLSKEVAKVSPSE